MARYLCRTRRANGLDDALLEWSAVETEDQEEGGRSCRGGWGEEDGDYYGFSFVRLDPTTPTIRTRITATTLNSTVAAVVLLSPRTPAQKPPDSIEAVGCPAFKLLPVT
jgi:hypothetical protein